VTVLKPQDLVVLLKLLSVGDQRPSYAQLATELFMSPSEIHASVQRARASRLIQGPKPNGRPSEKALEEFLMHGVKYAFPAQPGPVTRGIPTASAAAPLNRKMTQEDPAPVWPYEQGTKRGYAVTPLHKNVPRAALRDANLYQMLALVDAIRIGGARERELAARELAQRLRVRNEPAL
jgi:hypothetical protein